ncbi:MAG: hypothetical protein ABSE49_11175 [Polyangiaceae bacterium]|jgi:hypothetical protein
MERRAWIGMVGMAAVTAAACVPPGSAGDQDAGKGGPTAAHPTATAAATVTPSLDVMKAPFEDDFTRPDAGSTVASTAPPSPSGSSAAPPAPPPGDPGPDWMTTQSGIWRIEDGHLCGEHAKNHGIWLKRTLPVNARIEFDATAMSADGDLKAEYWGDGRSFATSLSYTNATSYLTIFGGWHNKFHVLARLNEHGNDRKEITVTTDTDDPREKPVITGQRYHFKVERSDGKTVKWWVDNNEMLTWADPAPLAGLGHDHFGFNDWDVKVCFDNVKVVPLPTL